MKAVLYDFKTSKEDWYELAASLYLKKIKFYLDLEIIHLKTPKGDREDSDYKIKAESQELQKKLSKDDFIIILDERGHSLDSLQFAQKFEQIQTSGKKRIVFVIGGAFGLGPEIKKQAHLSISLSKMVYNHLVAEVVLLEQIYRAYTIINKVPYHNV